MFDAFPFDEWGEDIAEFWTFGGEGSTGTYIMTALGVRGDAHLAHRLRRAGAEEAPSARRRC